MLLAGWISMAMTASPLNQDPAFGPSSRILNQKTANYPLQNYRLGHLVMKGTVPRWMANFQLSFQIAFYFKNITINRRTTQKEEPNQNDSIESFSFFKKQESTYHEHH